MTVERLGAFSWPFLHGHSRLAGYAARNGFLHGNIVDIERLTDSLFEGDLGVGVIRHGLHFGRLIEGEIALGLHDNGDGGLSEHEALLLSVESLLGEGAGGNSGLISRACLLQADHGVPDVEADLRDGSLKLQFAGPDAELIKNVISLRGPVAKGNVQGETG
jgi:hypothetical protein